MRNRALLGSSWHCCPWKNQITFRLASFGLRMLWDARVWGRGCDNVWELMSFCVAYEKEGTKAWSAKQWLAAGVSTTLQAMCPQRRNLCGTSIPPNSALTEWRPLGDWGQFYRILPFLCSAGDLSVLSFEFCLSFSIFPIYFYIPLSFVPLSLVCPLSYTSSPSLGWSCGLLSHQNGNQNPLFKG